MDSSVIMLDIDYRGVVALNNIGVTLLQRRCVRDAIRTFRDALDLMSCVRDVDRHSFIDEKHRTFLKTASRRMARSTKEKGIDSISSTSGSSFELSVLCQHENNTSEVLGATSDLYSGVVYRLELDETKLDYVTDSATILHNYSVALRVKGPTLRKKLRRKTMEQAAVASLVADNILSRQLESLSEYSHEHQEEMLKISMTILRDLIILSSVQKEVKVSTKYYSKLASVRSKLLKSQDFKLSKLQKIYVGAKAA